MTRSILLLLFMLAAVPAGAQSAVDFYHDAARLYIAEDNAEAERAATSGLALAPNDQKLRALLEKIRERNEQQHQSSNEEQEQNDAEESQQGEGDPQNQDESGQPQPSDEGTQETQQPSEGESQQEQQGEATGEQGEERESEAGQGEQASDEPPKGGGEAMTDLEVKPGEMSRAEAERILRAIQSDELELLRDVQRRRARPRYVEKDW